MVTADRDCPCCCITTKPTALRRPLRVLHTPRSDHRQRRSCFSAQAALRLSCRWHTQVYALLENGVVTFVGAFLLKQ